MNNPPTYDGHEGGVSEPPPTYQQAVDQSLREDDLATRAKEIKRELEFEKIQRAIDRRAKIAKMSPLQRWRAEQQAAAHERQMNRDQLLVLLSLGVKGEVMDTTFGPEGTRARFRARFEASDYNMKIREMGYKFVLDPDNGGVSLVPLSS